MIKRLIRCFFVTGIILFTATGIQQGWAKTGAASATQLLFDELIITNPLNMPSEEVFTIAYKGYNSLKMVPGTVKKEIITVIDFSLPSTEKRLWIIDLDSKKVLFNHYVAHGRNSGDDVAALFSNESGSYMSSIGFFITGETYHGKHGLSLRLEGMDDGFNSNARKRSIVMHGADYVSDDFIEKYGRLGRSLGCPSVSMEIHEQVIEAIKEGSALFIYYPDPEYMEKSQMLNSKLIRAV